jgi:hypothetical protein
VRPPAAKLPRTVVTKQLHQEEEAKQLSQEEEAVEDVGIVAEVADADAEVEAGAREAQYLPNKAEEHRHSKETPTA